MSDPTIGAPAAAKSVRDMTRQEYRQSKANMLRQIGIDAAAAGDQKVLDLIAAAPDDATRRKILRQFGR